MPVFSQYSLFGANVYMCYDYVYLDNFADCVFIETTMYSNVSSQSAPVERSLAMYRDPLTGPIVVLLKRTALCILGKLLEFQTLA